METSEQINELATALAKAQANFKPIPRDKTVNVRMKSGGQYTFSYAPLESILRAVKPALTAEGLALSQAVIATDSHEYLETKLMLGTQTLSNRVRIILVESGPQAYGSALMYARRYGVTLLLCICADDDDDGNVAEGNEAHVVKADTKNGLPNIDPRGEAYKAQDMKKAKEYADRFRGAMSDGNENLLFELHSELNPVPDFYIAVSTLLNPAERKTIKDSIHRVHQAQKNGATKQ
jgi:hypothetical protein